MMMVRLGARWRDLPFEAQGAGTGATVMGAPVTEKSLAAGLGTLFAGDRASLDFTAVRASRTAAIGASERAWVLSLGIAVRP
jgi:hypothetical protein